MRPHSDFFHLKKPKRERPKPGKMMYHLCLSRFETFTTYCVSFGSSPPSCWKMWTKTGTRNSSRPVKTSVANDMTMIG